MKNIMISLVVTMGALTADVIMPNVDDMNRCQKVSEETATYFVKADVQSIVGWFQSAASETDRTMISRLLNKNNLLDIERELNKFEARVEDAECKKFSTSLKESYVIIVDMLEKRQNAVLGTSDPLINLTGGKVQDLYIVAEESVKVVKEPSFGKRELVDTVIYGTGLILKERVKLNSFEEWGQFVYNNNTKIGWINLEHVVRAGK